MNGRLDYQEIMNQLPSDNIEALAECIDEHVKSGALSTEETDNIITLTLSDNRYYNRDIPALNKVMATGSGYTLGQKIAFFCAHGIDSDEARAIPGEILSRWLHINEIAKTKDKGVEAICAALDAHTTFSDSEYWPVFPALPDALNRLVEAKQAELRTLSHETPDEHRVSTHIKMIWDKNIWDKNIPSISNIMRQRLDGKPLQEWMLGEQQANIMRMPIVLRPLDELLSIASASPYHNIRKETVEALNQYPADDLYAQHASIRTLIQSFDDLNNRSWAVQQIYRTLPRTGDESARFLEQIMPAKDPVAPIVFMGFVRNGLDALISRDYLMDMIRTHRTDAKSPLHILSAPTSNQLDIVLDQYLGLKKITAHLKYMLLNITEHEAGAGADELTFNKALIRQVADVIRETRLDTFLYDDILSPLKGKTWGKGGGVENPIDFIGEALNAAKPFLKKSALDASHSYFVCLSLWSEDGETFMSPHLH
jgi:hypothetical protein